MKKLRWRWLRSWTEELEFDISDYIVPCAPSTSEWWVGLPRFFSTVSKKIKDYVNERHRKYLYNAPQEERSPFRVKTFAETLDRSAKECPGIMGIFRNSYLVKAPSDALITISKSMDIVVNVPEGSNFKIESHHFNQLASKHNLFAGRINLKFVLPVMLKSDNQMPWIFLNPTYHAKNEWDVIPGVIDQNYTEGMQLNINTLLDVSSLEWDGFGTYTLEIKKGTPLAYVWLPEKTKFVHDDSIKHQGKTKY